MKAIVYTQYGPPDVLQIQEVAKPTPKDNEVLVKLHAASANPADWRLMRGTPFFARFTSGLQKPKNTVLGADIAGRVEAIGRNVTQFQPGDEVFGEISAGGFAEHACVPENVVALKPTNISFAQAAAVPLAAITALQGLRDKGQIQAGQKVLINGASGGVGTFAVQLAKAFGAEVTGVCSTRNVEMVRSIGADHIIDYTQENFTNNGQRYDLILDNMANRSVSDYRRSLNPNGICVVVGFSTMTYLLQVALLGLWVTKTSGQTIGAMLANANTQDLIFLKGLLEAGEVVPVIDRCYPLSEAPEAIRYLEKGHARGKVVITIESSTDKH